MTFFPQTIKRYTVAILDLFSKMTIPNFDHNGSYVGDTIVPIVFAQQGKNHKANMQSTANIINGNNFSIPRAALRLNSISPARERDTSKHAILHLQQKNDRKVVFTFNSVSYDFQYSLYILCKNFCDATMILENILPLFRPTYTLPIYEIPIQQEPTSILLQLDNQNIEIDSDLGDDDVRLVGLQIDITLFGNIYLPIRDESMVKKLRLYINEESEDKFRKSLFFYNLEKIDDTTMVEFQSTNENIANFMRENEGAKSFYKKD